MSSSSSGRSTIVVVSGTISVTGSGTRSVRMYRENQLDHEYSVYVIIMMEEDSLSNDNKRHVRMMVI